MVNKENEREVLEREYRRLDQLESRRYSHKPSNSYKTVFMTLMGVLGIGCFGMLVWILGHKSGKNTCKR